MSTAKLPDDQGLATGQITGMKLKDILRRIEERLAATGKTADGASREAKKPDAIRNMKRAIKAGRDGVNSKTLGALAKVLETTPEWLLNGSDHELPQSKSARLKQPKTIEVPLLSWVAAGRLHRQDGVRPVDIEKYILADLSVRGDWIALEVQGDSMDLIARDGAIIFVDISDDRLRNDGFYVFALDDGSTTFKRYRAGKPPRLQPYSSNPDHETIYATEGLKVVGRVKRTMLDL